MLRDKCIFQTMLIDKMKMLNYVIMRQLRSNDIRIGIRSIEGLLGVPDRISTWVKNISETLYSFRLLYMPEQFTESIVQGAQHLKSLKLIYCDLSIAVVTILEQRPVSEITLYDCRASEFKVNSQMQKVRMCNLYSLSDTYDFRIYLPDQLISLRSLQLEGDWVSEELLIRFCLHCPNVVHFSVCTGSTTESAMIAIMQNFQNLQSLEFTIGFYCTNQVLDVIAERHGHSLHRLSIYILTETLLVDVHRLLSACLHLHTLYLSSFNANGIAAPDFDILSEQHLTLTSLFIFSDIDRRSLQAIADHCKHIRVVGFISLDQIDEREVYTILSECTQLQKVSTSGCSSQHDPGIMDIMDKLRNSWPEVQFIHGDFPMFDVMAYE